MRDGTEKPERQPSFFEVGGDPIWERPARPSRGRVKWPLPDSVRDEVGAFQATLLSQGRLRPGSVDAYGEAMALVAGQAQRFLGRPLAGLAEIYQVDVIAAVAQDDVPLDETKNRLRKSTLRLGRTALGAHLQAVGLPGMSYQEARAVLDQGFRLAARRRGYRYIIAAGRRPGHYYRPPREDADRVKALARLASTTFVGPRNALVLTLARRTGLRCHSILAMDGADFSERHGQLFLLVTEKGRAGRREIEIPADVIPELTRYETAYRRCALERGWPQAGVGVAGPFWRGCSGKPWTYAGLLGMVRTYTRIAGVRPFTMHGLRHLRALVLESHAPPEEAALAGGWRNVGVFERHYARSLGLWRPELPGPEPPEEPDLPGPQSAREGDTSGANRSSQLAS